MIVRMLDQIGLAKSGKSDNLQNLLIAGNASITTLQTKQSWLNNAIFCIEQVVKSWKNMLDAG